MSCFTNCEEEEKKLSRLSAAFACVYHARVHMESAAAGDGKGREEWWRDSAAIVRFFPSAAR
jgi:hypothetical protein